MDELKKYVKESLLDDEDDLLNNIADAKDAINEWVSEQNLLVSGMNILDKLENGKYLVDADEVEYPSTSESNIKCFNQDQLTNELFKWNVVNSFTCQYLDNLKTLEGAPKKCNRFLCDGCKKLKSLEGAPQKCKIFSCSSCSKIKSLKGAPVGCKMFFAEYCGKTWTATDIKKYNITPAYQHVWSYVYENNK